MTLREQRSHMLVKTVSANPREPHRFEAIDQNPLVASSFEIRRHYSSSIPHTLLSVLPPEKLSWGPNCFRESK
jgi:hypothetical protein